MRQRIAYIMTTACCVWIAGAAVTLSQITQKASVIGAGGTEASGNGMIMRGTLGQPVIGMTTGSGVQNGQGFWFGVSSDGPSDVDEAWAGAGLDLQLDCLPNPVTALGRFYLYLPESGDALLQVYDALGRLQGTVVEGKHEAGEVLVEMNMEALDAGIYTAVLKAGNRSVSRQIIVVR